MSTTYNRDIAAPTRQSADIPTVVFAESLERTAMAVYDVITERGLLSAALSPVATLHRSHHEAHALALAEIADAVTRRPNTVLFDSMQVELAALGDEVAAVGFVRDMESRLATTHAVLLGRLTDPATIDTLAAVAPVESAHSAVLAAAIQSPFEVVAPGPTEPLDLAAAGYDPAQFPVT